jgi:cell division protein FtsW
MGTDPLTVTDRSAPLDGHGAARYARGSDRPRLGEAVVLALMTLGVIMVFSASRCVDASVDGYYFARHLMWLPVAVGVLAGAAVLPHRWLNRWWVAVPLLGAAVALLGLVLVFGVERNFARRWFAWTVGSVSVSFQPSEFAKLALVIFLAWFFARGHRPGTKAAPGDSPRRAGGLAARPESRRTHRRASGRPSGGGPLRRLAQDLGNPSRFWLGFLPAMVLVGGISVLVAKEDFGTAALIGTVAVLLCLAAGCRAWHVLAVLPFAALGFWRFVYCVDYRWERMVVFLDPWKHQDGAGWHICQSLLAIGRGGLFGVGLGAGVQKSYVPENATDFIFSVICEEAGIAGGILVLGLFGILVWRGGRIAAAAPDRFGFLLAAGVLLVIGLQAVMNIGVVCGALPAKGIGLPFVSYGGSGLVMMSAAAGLLASVGRRAAV